MRLEQGRDRHPSEQVLDALARAFMLDEEGTAHLRELARAGDPPPARAAAGRNGSAGLLRLMDALAAAAGVRPRRRTWTCWPRTAWPPP